MSSSLPSGTWREPILAQFSRDIASVARLTVVADPDELLTEQGIVDGIRQRGFEIVPFDDHVAFRYAYERRFRVVWDNGDDTNLVVVLRAARSDISGLPFDLLQQAERDRRLLSFSLAELFPSLAPHVLFKLDRGDLDAVSAAQQLFKPEPMGENATRDFLLRNVFRLDPAQIQSDSDLLRALLRRHYSGKIIPKSLDERLIHLLRSTGRWHDWPLDQILPSRASFLEFLQERWPIFLQHRFGLARRRTVRGARTLRSAVLRSKASPLRPRRCAGLRRQSLHGRFANPNEQSFSIACRWNVDGCRCGGIPVRRPHIALPKAPGAIALQQSIAEQRSSRVGSGGGSVGRDCCVALVPARGCGVPRQGSLQRHTPTD